MRELLSYGIDGWTSYTKQGTASVFVIFALIYLAYVFFWQRKNMKMTPLCIMVRILVVLFAALLCPGVNRILSKVNPTEDATYLFLLIPTALVMGMAGVELYNKLEDGEYGRFKKAGLFICSALLFVMMLTSPFLISTDRFSFTKNADRIPQEVYELNECIGEDTALLPGRYASTIGEVNAMVRATSMTEAVVDETDPEAMAKAGQEGGYNYVVVDKKVLTTEALEELEETFEENNYSIAFAKEDMVCFRRGSTWVLTEHGDASGNQSLFYTLYNKDEDALIVVDGGWTENADYVREVINGYGGHVTAWILTHFHADHAGAFNAIYGDPQDIVIDDIYVSNYDSAYDVFLKTYQPHDNPETFALYMEQTNGGKAENIHHPKRGDELDIAGLHLKFYNTYDEKLLSLEPGDTPNHCSLVVRISGAEKAFLVMGDMYAPAVGQWMVDTYGEELRSDFVNCAHHGNSIMPISFYEAILKPEATMMFDAPQYIVESDDYLAKDLAAWADENGYHRTDYRIVPYSWYLW